MIGKRIQSVIDKSCACQYNFLGNFKRDLSDFIFCWETTKYIDNTPSRMNGKYLNHSTYF